MTMESLFNLENGTVPTGPVECLGMVFPDDNARREYFLGLLREKLKDPVFRAIEGFPIGSDEDILALSDPPYYTACPNPFIEDFIRQYGKPYDPNVPYSREPFAADVSEGKNDPIYNAHSYHTKVPHKAIMRYILHYTEPGDVVFDGFCGTGMSGVAAQLCGDRSTVQELGYKVDSDGTIKDKTGEVVSRIGARKCVLSELSVAATFITRGYNTSFIESRFAQEAEHILSEVEATLRPLYSTRHDLKEQLGIIDYTVWSDVFICENCAQPIVLWDAVMNPKTRRRESRNEVPCPHCKHIGDIQKMSRKMETYHDPRIGNIAKRVKQEPIFIQYRLGVHKHEKNPDESDRRIANKCDELLLTMDIPYPVLEMPDGLRKVKDAYHLRGITHTHHFFTSRNLMAFAHLWNACSQYKGTLGHQLRFWLTSVALGFTKLNRYFESSYSQVNRYLKGTLYVAPFTSEVRPAYALAGKIKRLLKLGYAHEGNTIISTGSSTQLTIPDQSVDYIFTDPPFGRNIQYSELNFLWESWLGVRTNANQEAIVDETIGKQRDVYHTLIHRCFQEFYRVLKPGRWITVEFHNSENAIWTIIQESLLNAGFVVADVRVLDKKQITMQQWVGTNVVSKDLVISAYKPNGGLEDRFKLSAGTEDGVWDFVRTHLKQLPVFVSKEDQAEVIAERQNFLLFDRMVAFHVQRGVTVPISAAEFYQGLVQRFPERDGMYFLPEQVAEYDKKRMTVKEVLQLQLFVTDESSAIQWLKQQLLKKPQTFQELHPQFLKEIGGWQKHEKPLELSELLEQNFLRYDGKVEVPSQIHTYLSTNFKELRNLPKDNPDLRAKGKDRWYVPDPNKASDLEKLRERALLREFEEYRESKQKRLKVFRLEAVRAGFKKAWQERDYATIISVAGKIPENVLQEDPKLLMWYDQALTRTGGID
ncbi:MAG: DNA methyltransferase [Bacillota bacterium]